MSRGVGENLEVRGNRMEPKLLSPKHEIMAGDRALDFVLPSLDGKFYQFYEKTRGNPSILLFYPSEKQKAQQEVAGFTRLYEKFLHKGIDIFAITTPSGTKSAEHNLPFMLWIDQKKKITEHYLNGAGITLSNQTRLTAFLLDQNQRVISIISGAETEKAKLALELFKKKLSPTNIQTIALSAPALIIPNLLDSRMCKHLINLWEQGEKKEGTVLSVVQNEEVNRVHAKIKKRRDHLIIQNDINKALQITIGRRIATELNIAFNFRDFRFDRFLVGCYEADRGDYFRPHRDNLAPSTKDRIFALTLNLNSNDYEGGELVFPEYGPHKYKPGKGGGILFSCSLLHEALPVTKGNRFALLSFLRPLPTQKHQGP